MSEAPPTTNSLGFTVTHYTDEMARWSPALKTAIYDQAYESACSVVFRSGIPQTPAEFLTIAYALASAAVAGMSLSGFVALEVKGQAPEDEVAVKRAQKHDEPELPFPDVCVQKAGGGYL